MTHGDQKKEAIYPAQQFYVYVFVDLEPATTYQFKIAACSEYTKQCGNWSKIINGTTMDGGTFPLWPTLTYSSYQDYSWDICIYLFYIPVCSAPQNLIVTCRLDNVSSSAYVSVTWEPPAGLNGVITRYTLELTGSARYRNDLGRQGNDWWRLPDKTVKEADHNYEFERVPPNTNYSVKHP